MKSFVKFNYNKVILTSALSSCRFFNLHGQNEVTLTLDCVQFTGNPVLVISSQGFYMCQISEREYSCQSVWIVQFLFSWRSKETRVCCLQFCDPDYIKPTPHEIEQILLQSTRSNWSCRLQWTLPLNGVPSNPMQTSQEIYTRGNFKKCHNASAIWFQNVFLKKNSKLHCSLSHNFASFWIAKILVNFLVLLSSQMRMSGRILVVYVHW